MHRTKTLEELGLKLRDGVLSGGHIRSYNFNIAGPGAVEVIDLLHGWKCSVKAHTILIDGVTLYDYVHP